MREGSDACAEQAGAQAGATLDNCVPNSSSFCCSGVFSCSVSAMVVRIFPANAKPHQLTHPSYGIHLEMVYRKGCRVARESHEESHSD